MPVIAARKKSSIWICELLFALGAQDYEVTLGDYNRASHGEYPSAASHPRGRGKARTPRRSWDWVGKYWYRAISSGTAEYG